jgi:hypothetical protein
MINQHPVTSSQPGNAAVEYSLAGCFVLVTCLGVLLVLGQNINMAMQAVRTDITEVTQSTQVTIGPTVIQAPEKTEHFETIQVGGSIQSE